MKAKGVYGGAQRLDSEGNPKLFRSFYSEAMDDEMPELVVPDDKYGLKDGQDAVYYEGKEAPLIPHVMNMPKMQHDVMHGSKHMCFVVGTIIEQLKSTAVYRQALKDSLKKYKGLIKTEDVPRFIEGATVPGAVYKKPAKDNVTLPGPSIHKTSKKTQPSSRHNQSANHHDKAGHDHPLVHKLREVLDEHVKKHHANNTSRPNTAKGGRGKKRKNTKP